MSLFKRAIATLMILLLAFWPVAAQDWQGLAGRGRAGDFPTGGMYAASNAFPKNSLVDVVNPASGKTVRVVITRDLNDASLFLALSPEAADAVGIDAGRTVQVQADAIPLPGVGGSRYVPEPPYSRDPDLNPSAGLAVRPSASPKAASTTSPPVQTPAPTPVALAPSPTPSIPSPEPTPAPVPVATEAPAVGDVPDNPVATPAPVAPTTPAYTAPVAALPAPAVSPSPSPTPVARHWIGVQQGVASLKDAPVTQHNVGTMTAAPVASGPSAEAPKALSTRGTGIAKGLQTYGTGGEKINNGDVARPDQSLWLTGAAQSKVANNVPQPAVSPDPDAKGPDASKAANAPTNGGPAVSWALASPSVPESKSTALSAGVKTDGQSMYDRELADVLDRSSSRTNQVDASDSGVAETSHYAIAPATSASGYGLAEVKTPAGDYPGATNPSLDAPGNGRVASGLPEARQPNVDRPEASNPYLEGQEAVVAGDLPVAIAPSKDRVDGGIGSANPANRLDVRADLPIAGAPVEGQADGGMALKAEPPTVAIAKLPESKVGSEEKPEVPVPSAFADNVLVSLVPAEARPPKALGPADAFPGSTPGTYDQAGNLITPNSPTSAGVDGGTGNLNAQGQKVSDDLRTPGTPGYADAGNGSLSADGTRINPDLPSPNSTQADGDRVPSSPEAQSILAALAEPKNRNPNAVEASNSSLLAGQTSPDTKLPGPGVQNADSLAGRNAPGSTQTVPGSLTDAQVKQPGLTHGNATKASPNPLDPRVSQILGYLEPAGSRTPVSANKTSPVLGNNFADTAWAKSHLPLIGKLQGKLWYIQVGSFTNPKTAGDAIRTVQPGYPVSVLPEAKSNKGIYKVFVGPLKEDEKGLILYWFRSKGYRDAFVRQGT